jgi:hypothetical protein
MRRATIPLMLAVAGALLAACGSSHPARRTSSTAAARPGETITRTPTRPQALAFAQAVNLTPSDVPGFTISSARQSESAREKLLERQMLRCVGAAGPSASLADVSSKSFELKRGVVQLGVSSEVAVARTPAATSAELAAIRSSHVRGCFSHYLDLLFKGQQYAGARVGSVTIASGTPPAPGASGSFGWRITANLITQRVRLPFYMDILGFVNGPTRVTLFSSGALRPFPAEAQQRLFSLLLDRAKAHAL